MQLGFTGRGASAMIVLLALSSMATTGVAVPPVHVEPGPIVDAVQYDGKRVKLETQTVTRPFCGSVPNAITVGQLAQIARQAEARAAAQQAPLAGAMALGGPPPRFNLIFNIIGSLPAGAAEALAEVEQYIEAQFDDPITVTVNFQFASLPPNVLGATSSNYVTVQWPDARPGLQNGMDADDIIQDYLPAGATIPVRYDGNSASVTNETRVFVTRANYKATIGDTPGSAASITFSSNFPWDYDPTNGISGGTWCFRSVIIHEVGHALGFVSGADFRTNDSEMLDVYRFQRSDGAGDYNPDTLEEFQTTARMVDQNAPGTNDDVNSDLISVEYQMSDADPNQASHFHDQTPAIGIMDPTIGSTQTFHPNFFRTPDLNMFDAIGYDYPHVHTSCEQAAGVACNDARHTDNLALSNAPDPAFTCGTGSSHTGTVWFSFVADAESAFFSTCSSQGTDSTFAVYSGTCGSLTQLVCSESGGCGSGNNSAKCVSGLTPGQVYYIQLSANSLGTRGQYTVEIECSCDGACCVPPPEFCATEKEDTCAARGGEFLGGGTTCPLDPEEAEALCQPPNPVFSQQATGNQEDLASNVDWSDATPNQMLIDDFRADGRPITHVRWWGSALDGSVTPNGWMISFHEPKGSGDPAGEALGVYFCEAAATTSSVTSLAACDAEIVVEYSAALSDCCLVHSSLDSRTSETPATPEGFEGESCTDYEIGIGAAVGQTYDAGTCSATPTAQFASAAYWGWHTSVIQAAPGMALTGPVDTGSPNLPYGGWAAASATCGQPNMAVELLTNVPASPIQVFWDNGPADDVQRLNSQSGGQYSDWFTADDFTLTETTQIVSVRSNHEEESNFVWAGRVRVEIYPDIAGMPDESGGATDAFWVPDDRGAVSRINVGPGTFFPTSTRFQYHLTGVDVTLPAGSWWIVIAPAGTGVAGRTFWLTSRTLSVDGYLLGSQSYFRWPSGNTPTFTPWSTLLIGQQHDMSFILTISVERDCNCNSISDYDELAGNDCNGNLVLDECEPDCNNNDVADECDISGGESADCNGNERPDECDITYETSLDSDGDGVPNECDICPGFDDAVDTDSDTVPDGCDACPGFDDNLDADGDMIADDCDNCPDVANPGQDDFDEDGIGDACDLTELEGEAGGVGKNRFASIVIPPPPANRGPGGMLTAIRVTLTTLNHPRFCCTDTTGTACSATTCAEDSHCSGVVGNPVCAHQAGLGTPDFTAFEGKIRYLNSLPGLATPHVCPDDGPPFNTNYRCATLGCEPEYRDWAGELAVAVNPPAPSGLVYFSHNSIVPSSTVHAQNIADSCGTTSQGANACSAASLPLAVSTAKWGDITGASFSPPDGKSDVLDIPSITNKLKNVSPILAEYLLWLKQTDPAPHTDAITVIDLSDVVDAGPFAKTYPAGRTISSCAHD